MFRTYRVRRRRKASQASVARYEEYKEAARALVHARLLHFAPLLNVTYKKVFIKNSRTRWGSCSKLGNLNFNYRLALLSPELADYVVVHELCHLLHFNHSKVFWDEVGKLLPEWQRLRTELRKIHF